jgi:hypothetical protein
LPRSKNLRARSWLKVGRVIRLEDALPYNDVVILSRGENPPPADVINAPGHVGFYAGQEQEKDSVLMLGGNQNNEVNISPYAVNRILGVRRLK